MSRFHSTPFEPIVSVVIPAFNEQYRIRKTVKNVLANADTFPQLEIIVVNNNSADNTLTEALKAQADADALGIRLKVITALEKGPAPTRNAGAHIANGQFLFFLDADTTVDNTFLDRNVKCIHNRKLAAAGVYMRPDSGKLIDEVLVGGLNGALSIMQYTPRAGAFGAALFFDRMVFNQMGGFDPAIQYGEDMDLVRRTVGKGYRFRMLSTSVRTSTRRAQKHGRWKLMKGVLQLAMYFAKHGTAKGATIEYNFGDFNETEELI